MTLRHWEYPHDDDDPCPCEDDPFLDRKPCPTHLTLACDGCGDRLPEADTFALRDGGHWCAACCVADVEPWDESSRERLAEIGVWLPQDLATPTDETWAFSHSLRESLARDLDLHGCLTWAGLEVTIWAGPGQRLATIQGQQVAFGGAMQRLVIRRAAL